MALDLRVQAHEPLTTHLATTVQRAITPETRGSQACEGFFSDSFVRHHTEFESFDAFCRACPSDRDTVGGLRELPPDERREFVATNTDFETWAEMKRSAAATDLVTLHEG